MVAKVYMPSGMRFGRLTVVSETNRAPNEPPKYLCICDCGTTTTVRGGGLRSGRTVSCGCYSREKTIARNLKHGHRYHEDGGTSSTYKTWLRMKRRCENKLDKDYSQYGGRGIIVCDRWRKSFENFLADMGERLEGTTLDRIDVDGDYAPSNCRWATAKQQVRNRRNTRLIEHCGRKLSAAAWAEETGIPYLVIKERVRLGWSDSKIVSTPQMRRWSADKKTWAQPDRSIDEVPADALPLAAECAETTLTLESLQGWVTEQSEVSRE